MDVFQSDVNGDSGTGLLVLRSVLWPDRLLGRRLGSCLVRHGGEQGMSPMMETALVVVQPRGGGGHAFTTAMWLWQGPGWDFGHQV